MNHAYPEKIVRLPSGKSDNILLGCCPDAVIRKPPVSGFINLRCVQIPLVTLDKRRPFRRATDIQALPPPFNIPDRFGIRQLNPA
jgi:hypothetical protein